MSLHTWTPAALSSEARPYEGVCWRLVEAQHRVSTLKLVDTLAEQTVLEDLIEASKPAIPQECRHLDYLLATPFRYGAEYPRGSRFRRAGRTPGVFYASEEVATAVAELSFHRLLFFAESPATPWPNDAAEYTAFAARVRTARSIDLAASPLAGDRELWMQLAEYEACQTLSESAYAADVALIRYESVRDPNGGINIAVLTCRAFAAPEPIERQPWRIRLGAGGIQALCEFPAVAIEFAPDTFAADPRLEGFRWER